MLVVVTIMMLLVAVSATAFRPANDSRRIREAARAINVYLGSARNRAMETGRPAASFSAVSARLRPRRHDRRPVRSAAELLRRMTVNATLAVTSTVGGYRDGDGHRLNTPALFPLGDLIQFNCQGPLYKSSTSTGPPAINPVVQRLP